MVVDMLAVYHERKSEARFYRLTGDDESRQKLLSKAFSHCENAVDLLINSLFRLSVAVLRDAADD